jgi:hypothetical protein
MITNNLYVFFGFSYYIQANTNVCLTCSQNCLSCNSISNCSACATNYIL